MKALSKRLLPLSLMILSINSYAENIPKDLGGPRLVPWTNDYKYLKDIDDSKKSLMDKLHYIQIGDESYLSLGGEIRELYQYWDHITFGVTPNDKNTMVQQRIRLHGDLHFSDQVRLFVELGDSREFNAEFPAPTANVSYLDFQQVFLDYGFKPTSDTDLNFRIGRFPLLFGTLSFIAIRNGAANWYTFDGIQSTLKFRNIKTDFFYTKPTLFEKDAFENKADDAKSLSGIYLTAAFDRFNIDGSYYNHTWDTDDSDIDTFGVRVYGNKIINYDVEFMKQGGHKDGKDVDSFALLADFSYMINAQHKLGIIYNVFSGDKNMNDNEINTFNSPNPKNLILSEAGNWNLMNIEQLQPYYKYIWNDKLSFRAAYSFLRKNKSSDAIYFGPNASPIIPSVGKEKAIANNLELTLDYKLNRYTTLHFDYAYTDAQDVMKVQNYGNNIYFSSGVIFLF